MQPGSYTDPEVIRVIDRLERIDLRVLEAEVTAKRIAWLDGRGLGGIPADPTDPVPPRQAYELLFRDYMGLPLAELPVVGESESEITWLSQNACSTLAACEALELDTRVVCRAVYDKSTQAFLSRIDPQLRFLRDYTEIRPYAPHCRERIVRVDFDSMMRIALEEAHTSLTEGNKGYGAVVALGERVLAHEHDTATSEGDPSLHAEFKALRHAVEAIASPDLTGALLFSTCEPCPMCAGLAVWANVTGIVFGASIADTARMGRSRTLVSATEIAERSPCSANLFTGS